MKLEVGKKYVDNKKRKWTCASLNPYCEERFVCVCEDGDIAPEVFNENGISPVKEFDAFLVKEYKEPLTKEVWVVWSTVGEFDDCDDWFRVYDEKPFKTLKTKSIKKITITEGEFDD